MDFGPLAQLVEQDPLKVKVRGSIPRRLIFISPFLLKKKFYKIIEHTADIGVAVEAGDLAGIFVNAAVAMFDIMAERLTVPSPASRITLNVTLSAAKPDELLIRWLNELLSLSATKGLIFVDYEVNRLDDTALDISVIGEEVSRYRFNAEIKAATYHDLELVKNASSYKAKVIFDV
jgi:SHS2 domain-containing protein